MAVLAMQIIMVRMESRAWLVVLERTRRQRQVQVCTSCPRNSACMHLGKVRLLTPHCDAGAVLRCACASMLSDALTVALNQFVE